MAQVTITVSGLPKVINKFNSLSEKIKNLEPEFKELGEYLTKYYSGVAFLSQGQVFGKSWQPLKSSKTKGKKFPGRQILESTGTMKNSFESNPSAKQLVVNNSAPYFKYHQSSKPRFKLPRRVMIGWNNTISKEAKQYINKGINRVMQG